MMSVLNSSPAKQPLFFSSSVARHDDPNDHLPNDGISLVLLRSATPSSSADLDQPAYFRFAFTFFSGTRPNSRTFFLTEPAWRSRDFAMSSALSFFLTNALSRSVSSSVHSRVISPSPSARARSRQASNHPSNAADHGKKPHRHPSLRVVLKLVCDKRRQNHKYCYLAHQSYRQATPVEDLGETRDHLAFARNPNSTTRPMASNVGQCILRRATGQP